MTAYMWTDRTHQGSSVHHDLRPCAPKCTSHTLAQGVDGEEEGAVHGVCRLKRADRGRTDDRSDVCAAVSAADPSAASVVGLDTTVEAGIDR